jgi:ABC-type uncharacterized transport system permease subunit
MTVPIETVLGLGGTAFYGVAAALAVTSLVRTAERKETPALAVLGGGALLLSAMLVIRVFNAGCIPSFTRFDALAAYVVVLSGVYLLLTVYRSTRGIAGILMPYAAVMLLCGVSALRMKAGEPPPFQGPWLILHVLSAYAAYGVFTLASLNAAVYLIQDYNLKHKRFGVVWERLPSLETLDLTMSRLVGVAFLLLTVSIVLGFGMVHTSGGGDEWYTDPKVAATVATWILLAIFVHLRASSDRHGRGIALMAVIGLACLFFAFMGVHMVATSTAHAFLQVWTGVN